ncbi:hypothetical protein PANT_15d00077 [Moesziomyces antarcticus T-34]|uniref:TFIIB-type domain-containing protein n=1 Tax=Pseudozyma antarctica (strain T-34) TaxID=1151754 RepID=M9M4R9_PSEA3|nr:hypothetical protein PANT_15d00077 [Moesziomyces antarcticus T-34]
MPSTCPECGSQETLSFIAEVGQDVCSDCGTVLQDLHLYEPTNRYEIAYALGGPSVERTAWNSLEPHRNPLVLQRWLSTTEEGRIRNRYHRKPEVDARISGILTALGHPTLLDQVDFLFQRAREISWNVKDKPQVALPDNVEAADESEVAEGADTGYQDLPARFVPPPISWGSMSLYLATACCYAVLRLQGVRVDLETVADAAQIPFAHVRRAFHWLRLLVRDAVRGVRLFDPDVYVRRVLAFFRCQLESAHPTLNPAVLNYLKPLQASALGDRTHEISFDPARILSNTPFEAVEATALQVCSFWWRQRQESASKTRYAAFAAAVLAMEAHLKMPAPLTEIFRHTLQALNFDVAQAHRSDAEASSDDLGKRHAMALHAEICAALRLEALKIPWLTGLAPISQKVRYKNRRKASKEANKEDASEDGEPAPARMTELVRRDLIVHAIDVLQVWQAVEAKVAANFPTASAATTNQPVSPRAKVASRKGRSKDKAPASDEASELDSDWDELECFVSTTRHADERDATEALKAEEADDDVEIWPRIEKRLKAEGIDAAANRMHGDSADVADAKPHPIDLLTDEQVDRLLFEHDELQSILRTDPAERAAVERAKVTLGVWTQESEYQRNAEIAALARRAEEEREAQHQRHSATKRGSLDSTVAERAGPKRRKQPSSSRQDGQTKQKSKKGRTRAPAAVSLRDQRDESDWSD